MMTDVTLANATLVLPNGTIKGSIHLSGGKIAAMDSGTSVPKGAVDCSGDLVLPGLIELHTDNLERHIEPRPKVHFPHAGAILAHDGELAATGITTVFDALRVGSIVSKAKASYGEYARLLADEITREFARAEGAAFITGNGVSRPQGFLAVPTAATADATRPFGTLQYIAAGAAGNFAAATPENRIIDLVHALKPAYRQGAALIAEWPECAGGFKNEAACLSITLKNAEIGRMAIVSAGPDWLGRAVWL